MRAASVASQVAGGLRQLSQLPQGRLLLAEVGKQAHAPAVVRLGQREQRVELAALHLLEFVAGRALVDHAALVDDVGQAVGHPGVGGLAVAARAARFLVVALDVLGQVEVAHEAHVGLVDAHAERDGGGHHEAVLAQEAILVAAAHVGIEARVIRQRRDALGRQPRGGLFHLLAALAVDDAGVALVLVAQEAQQLLLGLVLLDDRVADVGPVEAGDELARALQREALAHVRARVVVGGGGERHARHVGEALVQLRELQVVLAEIVAPLADAMRLVDGHQAQQAALVQRGEHAHEARVGDALGRGVEHHQPAAHHLALDARGRSRPTVTS